MAYATVTEVQARMNRTMSAEEETICAILLADAAVIIDDTGSTASDDVKKIVSCNLVMRKLGDGSVSGVPIGATQGTMSGLGYSQSWTISGGGNQDWYMTKLDKKLLGINNKIGAYSPLEG